jgi:CelD/BcsL family acetyltransferase involved in cellulose biosynthesis
VTVAQADDLEQQIETLLAMWQERWGPHPLGLENVDVYRTILRRCMENGLLTLYTLWHADTAIAAMTCLVDRQKSTVSAHIIAWNGRFAKMSPGTMMYGYSIQDAIQNGMQEYDFLRGDEGFKRDRLGAADRLNTSLLVTRKSLLQAAKDAFRRQRVRAKSKLPE